MGTGTAVTTGGTNKQYHGEPGAASVAGDMKNSVGTSSTVGALDPHSEFNSPKETTLSG